LWEQNKKKAQAPSTRRAALLTLFAPVLQFGTSKKKEKQIKI